MVSSSESQDSMFVTSTSYDEGNEFIRSTHSSFSSIFRPMRSNSYPSVLNFPTWRITESPWDILSFTSSLSFNISAWVPPLEYTLATESQSSFALFASKARWSSESASLKVMAPRACASRRFRATRRPNFSFVTSSLSPLTLSFAGSVVLTSKSSRPWLAAQALNLTDHSR